MSIDVRRRATRAGSEPHQDGGRPDRPRAGRFHGSRSGRARRVGAVAVMPVGVLLGWALVWAVAEALEVAVARDDGRTGVLVGTGVVATLVAVAVVVLVRARRHAMRRDWAPAVVVGVTAVAACGLPTLGLHGTRWGFYGLYSDAGFRTQMVTRFADTAALVDYGYLGLPAYYPPAVFWLEGRLADLLGVPGWTMVKPGALVLAAVIPLLAYVFWRRVLPALPASLVVLATTLLAGDPYKPEQWLVLAVLVPWWLDLVRGVRVEGRRRLPWWGHGLILGALLLTHTFYFAPLAVATLLGWGVDLVRRRPWELGPVRAAVIAVTGLVVASPYVVPMVVARFTLPTDDLQLRWSGSGVEAVPLPGEQQLLLAAALVGLVWLLRRPRCRLIAEGLALGVVGSAGFLFVGEWLQALDVALLPHKARDVLSALGAAVIALAVLELGQSLGDRHRRGRGRVAAVPRWLALPVTVLVAVALVVPVTLGYAAETTGRAALFAQQTRYPDGSYPEGRPELVVGVPQLWEIEPSEVPTDRVRAAWREVSGRSPAQDGETVLVTARVDLLATTPVHPFTSWKSIYSHPNGEYAARLALLREVAGCRTSACAAELLRENRFDRVHGLVLLEYDDELVLTVGVDDFPNAWVYARIRFPERLFRGPDFRRTNAGRIAVIALQP